MNSSTERPAFLIWLLNRPGPSSRWSGIESDTIDSAFSMTAWLPD